MKKENFRGPICNKYNQEKLTVYTRVKVEKFWTKFGQNFINSTYTRVTKTIAQNVP
jgi:hypothetical protein